MSKNENSQNIAPQHIRWLQKRADSIFLCVCTTSMIFSSHTTAKSGVLFHTRRRTRTKPKHPANASMRARLKYFPYSTRSRSDPLQATLLPAHNPRLPGVTNTIHLPWKLQRKRYVGFSISTPACAAEAGLLHSTPHIDTSLV